MIELALVWHQHQPDYRDDGARCALPWVRLHGTKDYLDMLERVTASGVHATFNLVPILLEQLQGYVEGTLTDDWLEIARTPAAALSEAQRRFLHAEFFHAHPSTMIEPLPRYAELFRRREQADRFTADEDRDLQVLFHLAWIDPWLRARDPRLARLGDKGRQFTEGDKQELLGISREILARVIPAHRDAAARGQVELTTTPYAHPILPLLIDPLSARMAMPAVNLPAQWSGWPEDAAEQIRRAVASHADWFGAPPQGLWPSEGSVSEAVVPLLASAGVQWFASDEEVLRRSLPKDAPNVESAPYQPWRVRVQGAECVAVFRDRRLSDLIGFTYARMGAGEAVEHFLAEVRRVGEVAGRTLGGRPPLVLVVLDGENCWESFHADGHEFLTRLYAALAGAKDIRTTTVTDHLRRHAPTATLTRLWAGSWIRANFGIWIGPPEDNAAWDALGAARAALEEAIQSGLPAEAAEAARRSLFSAEGSDWCWWYGDDHVSAHAHVFDRLFRQHLMRVYRLIGRPVPDSLRTAIKWEVTPRAIVRPPTDCVTPTLDGHATSYFEWLAAGRVEVGPGGAMHRVTRRATAVFFGMDRDALYLRLDLDWDALKAGGPALLEIRFLKPAGRKAGLAIDPAARAARVLPDGAPAASGVAECLEIGIRFDDLGVRTGDGVSFRLLMSQGGVEVEAWPEDGTIEVARPGEEGFPDIWSA